MSEPGTRKRKRASLILMATSFLCSTFVGFSLYFLHHFLLDLLVGIFSVAMMILCLVMFILKKPF
jgi:cyanate permease